MGLEDYAKKRTFEKTPEPAGAKPVTEGQTRGGEFCFQRHRARRLHYDLRIEVGGTLKSWAVPQGPSPEAGVKRLAVMVEDHPLAYAEFEGTIPKGSYGAGSVMLWDRGAFDLLGDVAAETQLARGDLKFRLHGEKLNGDFAIVLMKGRGKGKRGSKSAEASA